MTVTNVLQEQSGIQYQGVQDKSEADPRDALLNVIITGQFKRGRTDKPFQVTKHDYRAKLGHDPENPDYVAVEDALADGAPFIWVQRIDEGDSGPVITRKGRTSGWVDWSTSGKYLFARDMPTDGSMPFIRWFSMDWQNTELNELPQFITDSGHFDKPYIKTSPDDTLLAVWDFTTLGSQRPELFDISNPQNVQKIAINPPFPFMGNNYQADVLYDNGIQQAVFTEDNQYLVLAVYGNTNREEVEGLTSIYKRSEDGKTFNLIKKVFDMHLSYGVGVSVIGSKMRLVSNMGSYIYGAVLDLQTNVLTSLGYKDVPVNSGSYQSIYRVENENFIMESQFHGLAVIKFSPNHDGFTVDLVSGNNGASRLLTYCQDTMNTGLAHYFGMSYDNGLVIGSLNTISLDNTYMEYNLTNSTLSLPKYFNQPKLSPVNRLVLAYHTDENFIGCKDFINLIAFDPSGIQGFFVKKPVTINYNAGMEYA